MGRQLRDDRKAAPCSFGKERESPSPPPPPPLISSIPSLNIIFNTSLKRGLFDDDDDKTIKIIPTGEQQQQQQQPVPLPPDQEDNMTRLTLGWWGPHTPTTIIESDDDQVVLEPPPDNNNNNNPFLELRIGPPIQRRRVFPDGYWEITKSLTKSDVNGSSRLLLPRKLVQDHILVHLDNVELAAINEEDGLEVSVLDVDTDTHHILAFKLWSSSKSYVLAKNWSSDFVRRRGLSENREIGIRWDRQPGSRSLEFTLFD
ncbi:hypothetical protein ABFX02_14G233400 [Erythranthe guttata]